MIILINKMSQMSVCVLGGGFWYFLIIKFEPFIQCH